MKDYFHKVNESKIERADGIEAKRGLVFEDPADEDRWYRLERYQAEMLAEAIEEAEGRAMAACMCRRPW